MIWTDSIDADSIKNKTIDIKNYSFDLVVLFRPCS